MQDPLNLTVTGARLKDSRLNNYGNNNFLFVERRNHYNNVSSKSKTKKLIIKNYLETKTPEYNENIPDLE